MAEKNKFLCVAGCGYWGKNLVRNFADLGVLAAVCDPQGPTAEKYSAEYSAQNLSWEMVLQDPDIKAVAISTPAILHYRMAKQALNAGKHVFVEKPLALEVSQAEEVCRLAESKNLRLMVGHLLQYHPAFLKLKEMASEGALGRLQYIYSHRMNLGKIRREENILWSFAPHDISMILSLAGEEPQDVVAVGSHFLHERIDDVTTTHLSFPNGVRGHIFVSWLHPYKEQKLVVIGDKAMAVFNDTLPLDQKLQIFEHKITWEGDIPTPQRADGKFVVLPGDEPLRLECAHFIDCVVKGRVPQTDGREGMRVLSVLSKAQACLTQCQDGFAFQKAAGF